MNLNLPCVKLPSPLFHIKVSLFSQRSTFEKWKLKSLSCVQLFVTPWNSPGQNTRVGSLSFLQGIFPTLGSNPGLSRYRQILYQPSHKRSTFTALKIRKWCYFYQSYIKIRKWNKQDIRIPNGKKQAFTKLFQISNGSNSRLRWYFLTSLLGDGAITLILRSANNLLTIAFMFSLEMSA